jgi:hypothetical protein
VNVAANMAKEIGVISLPMLPIRAHRGSFVSKHCILHKISQEEAWRRHVWRPKQAKSFRDNPTPSLETVFGIKLFDGAAIREGVLRAA